VLVQGQLSATFWRLEKASCAKVLAFLRTTIGAVLKKAAGVEMVVGPSAFVILLAVIAVPQSTLASSQVGPVTSAGASFENLSQAAEHARDEKRENDAVPLYQQALRLKPEWEEGLWSLGLLLYNNGRSAEATDLFRRLSARSPKSGLAWAMLGLSEFETHDYQSSRAHLERSMSLGFADIKALKTSVLYTRAIVLTKLGRFGDSISALLGMAGSGDEEKPLVEAIGLAAMRMPLLPREIAPDKRELIRMAGEAAFALQDQRDAEAEKLFAGMEAQYPKEPGVHYFYGTYLLLVRPEDGIREMQRELEISPLHVPAKLRLAAKFMEDGHLDKAQTLAHEAVKLDPTGADAHMVLGEILIAKGNLAEAIHQLETAREQEPELTRVRSDLVRAYAAAGRTDDARKEKEVVQKSLQVAK
jgi:tetratricopeptide (TPR) repeat protein